MQAGPDYYPPNWNSGDVPFAKIKANGADFCILKVSQGTAYEVWGGPQIVRGRAAGLTMGGYAMLDGDSSGDGAAQAAFFLSRYTPKPGDIVPCVDFEDSGRGSGSLASYKQRLLDFVAAIHHAGFEVMLYGHSTVKACFADWRASGADFWWVPGSQPWSDVGARGPDLWQYQPYTLPAGYPHNFRGDGGREDASKVITALPVIGAAANGGNDDMALSDFQDGIADYLDHPDRPLPLPDAWPQDKKSGYRLARQLANAAVDAAVAKMPPAPATSGLTVSQGDQRYAPVAHGHTGTVTVA